MRKERETCAHFAVTAQSAKVTATVREQRSVKKEKVLNLTIRYSERERSHDFIIIYTYAATAAARSLQSCPTLCDPIDGSPPGSPILGILQARTLEWVAISFSNA